MTKEDSVPEWAKDENDPPATMWEKKKKNDDPEKDETEDKVIEDDKDNGIGPFVEGLYNATDEVEDDAEDETEEDMTEDTDDEDEDVAEVEVEDDESGEEDESEDEDMGEPLDEDDEEEDDTPPSDNATLDDLVPKENEENPENDEKNEPSKSEKGTGTPKNENDGSKGRFRGSFKYSPLKISEKFINWLNGTPEKPLPIFGWRAKFKRWRLIHFHNHVWLRIMSYDKTKNEYTICENLIHRRMLPKSAVHCTNEKNVYFDKLFEVPYEPWKDNGFGAMNAYLYMKDTSLDEALMLLWSGPKMSMRTLAIIGIVVVAAVFYLFYMMQG